MKKPHKSKPGKSRAKQVRAHGAPPAALVAHSTRRSPPVQRPDPRRPNAARHTPPATIYRRPNPLLIESRDDRQAFRLLLLPFVIMALVVAIIPSLHVFPTLRDLIAQTPQTAITAVSAVAELRAAPPQMILTASAEAHTLAAQPSLLALDEPALHLPVTSPVSGPFGETHALGPYAASVEARALSPSFDPQRTPAPVLLTSAAPPTVSERTPVRQQLSSPKPAFAAAKPGAAQQVQALEITPPALEARQDTVAMLAPPRLPTLLVPLPPAPYETTCPVSYGSAALPAPEPADDAVISASFGERLAGAAQEQTRNFVIYDAKYRQISRAGGDVPALYGVCTDVIIRAYRAMGIDLQTLVQASKLGAGDPNIDHRRTETLRRYLARYGQALPVTPYGEDYQPGDIITYWRPQNSGSRSHIALVSARLGPSGRPMIIHNRGWGPQTEDALFVDRITGHYRYDGSARPPVPPQLATTPARPFPSAAPTTSIGLRTTEAWPEEKPNGL